MKIILKNRRRWVIGGVLLFLTATPSYALFGIGDIVFDPTSYASLVTQATTALNQFKMIENNIAHFSFKQQWQTTLNALKNANVSNMFGETNGMSIALNTNSPGTSTTAWKTATVPVSSNTASYLQGQTVGNSAQLSQLAMIEMSDSISPDCLTAVGQYRTTRSQDATANSALSQQQFDIDLRHEQRSRAAESPQCSGGSESDRDAVAGRDAGLPRLPDDGREHAAAQRRCAGSQHRRLGSTAARGQRHQRGQ